MAGGGDVGEEHSSREERPASRRSLLAGGATAAVTAWAAPTILSIHAAAAATPPPGPPPTFGFYQSESVTSASSLTITLMNLNDPGSLVLVLGMRGTTTWTDPPGWALAGSVVDPVMVAAFAMYTKVRTTSTETAVAGFSPAATNAAAQMVFYRNPVTGAEPAGPVVFNAGESTDMEADAITTTGPDRMVVYGAGWETSLGSPTPPGFTNRGFVTSAALSITLADRLEPAPTVVGPTTAVLGASTRWGAGQVAVF